MAESKDPNKPVKGAPNKQGSNPPAPVNPPAAKPPPVPPMFRRIDWITLAVTTVLTLLGYLYTIAPDLTLEDCGELAVGSFYAGVPHAPGYPVWTVYSWLFTVILPFSNVAWRVAVSSAVAAALANGLLALMVSRGSSMILEGIDKLKDLDKRWENWLCMVSGFVAGVLIGFNGFMWSQAVIVEVYTLSVLSLMGVLALLMRWLYAPHQRKYLYWAFFLFGISFNNHQTLIVAAMGIEVLIAAAEPRLGRDLFLGNVLVWMIGLLCKGLGVLTTFDSNGPLYVVYNAVGLGSLAASVYLTTITKRWLPEVKPVLLMLLAWIIGAAFYMYMPVTGATNPPMNWGYPRTFDGFVHAFTRGQYEKTNPTNLFDDPWRFVQQIRMYFEGATDEFHLSFLLLALIPFCFLFQMQKRERAWILGNTGIYACLAFLLLILLNPNVDRQSRDLTKVFFTASHVTISMFVGYGLTLVGACIIRHYQSFRKTVLYGTAPLLAVALFHLVTKVREVYADDNSASSGFDLIIHGLKQAFANAYFTAPVYSVYAAALVVVLIAGFLVLILVCREKIKPGLVCAAFAIVPMFPLVSHWAENEQRGHIYGFWFGHDMFTPPFGLYPEMTRDAVLFGGTDPGRFCPTYMIFAESFIKPQDRRDPKFDRRDVYIITQNALADGTYLNYIRAHYNRSTQQDPPFFRDLILYVQAMAMGKKEAQKKAEDQPHRTNAVAKAIGSLTNVFAPFDKLITNFGKGVEDRRRREHVYPPNEIKTPSVDDSAKSFREYIMDAQRRLYHDQQYPNEPKQIKAGEYVQFTPDGRVQVAGQTAVMSINGLLTKVIFDNNPTNEFFVEESFPLDWMYPYLTPYGIIMKINRQPVPEFTEEMLKTDHEFWAKYSERLCGNFIKYDTSVKEICDFVERVYRRGDLRGYPGDEKFVRDNDAQKAFSKLRNSIAGLYSWRVSEAKTAAERSRVIREADFAFKQAFAFCPYSPETVTRYVTLLASIGRVDDAITITETCRKFDTDNGFANSLLDQLQRIKQSMGAATTAQSQVAQLEQLYAAGSNDIGTAFALVGAYASLGRTNAAFKVLDQVVTKTNVDANTLLSVAKAFADLGQYARAEPAFKRLTTLLPDNPEIWYDLAGAQTAQGRTPEALLSLANSMTLSRRRAAAAPGSSNLHDMAATDPRFRSLRELPEFQRMVQKQ